MASRVQVDMRLAATLAASLSCLVTVCNSFEMIEVWKLLRRRSVFHRPLLNLDFIGLSVSRFVCSCISSLFFHAVVEDASMPPCEVAEPYFPIWSST